MLNKEKTGITFSLCEWALWRVLTRTLDTCNSNSGPAMSPGNGTVSGIHATNDDRNVIWVLSPFFSEKVHMLSRYSPEHYGREYPSKQSHSHIIKSETPKHTWHWRILIPKRWLSGFMYLPPRLVTQENWFLHIVLWHLHKHCSVHSTLTQNWSIIILKPHQIVKYSFRRMMIIASVSSCLNPRSHTSVTWKLC